MASRAVSQPRRTPAARGDRLQVTTDSARRPPLRLVRGKEHTTKARRRRAAVAFVAAAVLVTGGLVGVVAAHVALTQGQFALGRLQAQLAGERAAQQQLRLQVAQLESPQRIVQTAEQRLHMATPATVTYLTPVTTAPNPPTPLPPASRARRAATSPASAHAASGSAAPPRAAATTAGGARR
jgi:cell division protein FtsL